MRYDVVIVGAGPAGLKAAEVLAKNNKKVLVLEKNKVIRPKCCAGGISNKDFEYIDKRLVERSFKHFNFHSKFQFRIIRSNEYFAYTIDRKKLGEYLCTNAKKAGASIKTGVRVKIIDKTNLIFNNDRVSFEFLIGADGSNSIVRKFLKLKNGSVTIAMHYKVKNKYKDMEFFFDFDCFGIGYAWIFPHKEWTSIGCGSQNISGARLKANFDKWLRKKRIGIKNEKFEAALINYEYMGYKFDNIYLIGDAAGLASPLTGEGIFQAMLSGEEVAKKILDKNYVCARLNQLIEMNIRRRKRIEELLKKSKTYMKTNLEIGTFLLRFSHFQKRLLKRILR